MFYTTSNFLYASATISAEGMLAAVDTVAADGALTSLDSVAASGSDAAALEGAASLADTSATLETSVAKPTQRGCTNPGKGMQLIIIIGAVMVLLVVALALVNGARPPRQFKKDWEHKKRRLENEQNEKSIEDAIREEQEAAKKELKD